MPLDGCGTHDVATGYLPDTPARTDRRIDFELLAIDDATGATIGRGRHQRAIVNLETFLAGAGAKR